MLRTRAWGLPEGNLPEAALVRTNRELQTARAEIQRQRQQLEGLAKIVRVHSAINAAVIRIRDRDELLQEACRLAAELGGFFGAVVWVVDGTGRWAWMKYRAGEEVRDSETLQRLEIGDGTGPDPSLSGRALRTGKVMVCKDIACDGPPVAGRDRLLARGIRSLIALPLIVAGKRVAVLTLTAREAAPAEDDELLRLLENIAASLAFALQSLESADAAQYLASFDPLTGLAKRALFCDRLDKQLQVAGRGARARRAPRSSHSTCGDSAASTLSMVSASAICCCRDSSSG